MFHSKLYNFCSKRFPINDEQLLNIRSDGFKLDTLYRY